MASLQFPSSLQDLFRPYRYKVIYGGRGSSKSWAVARFLIIKSIEKKIRVLCFRQLQNSIAESVHKLLCNQIDKMGYSGEFIITRDRIVGINGSEFIFKGIQRNVAEIKSLEGINYAWGEESEQITENSFNIIAPTIREPNSELIFTFNTRFKQDYLYKIFITDKKPPNSLVIKINYHDNPWFPQVLHEQMEHMRKTDLASYLNIWLGEVRQMATGAIFGKQVMEAKLDERIIKIPVQSNCEVDIYADLGKSDETAFWFVQRVGQEIRLIDYFEDTLQDVDYYVRYLKNTGYNIGTLYLPHDADHDRLGMTRNIKEQFKDGGIHSIQIIDRIPHKQTAIELAREMLSKCYFHLAPDDRGTRVEIGLDHLSNYRYKFNDINGVYQLIPLHDVHSNCADSFMCLAQAKVLNKQDKYSNWDDRVNY